MEPAWKKLGLEVQQDQSAVHLEPGTRKRARTVQKSHENSDKKPPKRPKLPKNQRAPPPVRDQYAYLVQFATDRAGWKFSKQKQNWLLRNIEHVPAEYEEYLVKYLSSIEGGGRERMVGELKQVVAAGRAAMAAAEERVERRIAARMAGEEQEDGEKTEETGEEAGEKTGETYSEAYVKRSERILVAMGEMEEEEEEEEKEKENGGENSAGNESNGSESSGSESSGSSSGSESDSDSTSDSGSDSDSGSGSDSSSDSDSDAPVVERVSV